MEAGTGVVIRLKEFSGCALAHGWRFSSDLSLVGVFEKDGFEAISFFGLRIFGGEIKADASC